MTFFSDLLSNSVTSIKDIFRYIQVQQIWKHYYDYYNNYIIHFRSVHDVVIILKSAIFGINQVYATWGPVNHAQISIHGQEKLAYGTAVLTTKSMSKVIIQTKKQWTFWNDASKTNGQRGVGKGEIGWLFQFIWKGSVCLGCWHWIRLGCVFQGQLSYFFLYIICGTKKKCSVTRDWLVVVFLFYLLCVQNEWFTYLLMFCQSLNTH